MSSIGTPFGPIELLPVDGTDAFLQLAFPAGAGGIVDVTENGVLLVRADLGVLANEPSRVLIPITDIAGVACAWTA